MSTFTITLPDDLEKRLSDLSEITGRSKISILLEALNEQLGDIEDILIAEQRLADVRSGKSKVYSSEEVWKILNVED